MPCLKEQVAIITGASSGIGAAIAKAYAAEGAHVILAARSVDKLQAVAHDIVDQGGKATPMPCDVTDEASVLALFEMVARDIGKLDLLVNNAGLAKGAPTDELSFETWREVMS